MNYEKLLISSEISVKESIKIMDDTAHKILIIINDCKEVKGVVTDGDVRRFILKNGNLDESVFCIANKNPIIFKEGYDQKELKKLMSEKFIEAIPIIDNTNKLINICFWHDFFEEKQSYYEKIKTPVVIMAGGKGTRLYPYTKILPKPLIPIGEKPIVEIIIDRFRAYDCKEFYISVNYKATMIKAYFNDIEKDYLINYIQEEKPLGTAGSLHLLKNNLKTTFFVSNCDVLIDANYSDMLKYHKEKNNKITMIASLKHYVIPYGVVEINEKELLKNIKEKPEFSFLVNTGMYILEPDVLTDIPENQFFHITDLINSYIKKGKNVGVYPISEKSWMDMGQIEELQDMLGKFGVK